MEQNGYKWLYGNLPQQTKRGSGNSQTQWHSPLLGNFHCRAPFRIGCSFQNKQDLQLVVWVHPSPGSEAMLCDVERC